MSASAGCDGKGKKSVSSPPHDSLRPYSIVNNWIAIRGRLGTRQKLIGVRVLWDLGRRWLSCPKNLRNSRMRDYWNRDTNALKLHDKQNRSQFPHLLKPCGTRFLWEFNFADFKFFRFRGKNLDFRLTRGNNTVCNQFHWSSAMKKS